ncbi:MAG: hypothetical protein ACLQKA_05100 [Bryobacteraceae bacterium]
MPLHLGSKPIARTKVGYGALVIAVGLYWFVVATWIDMRFIRRKRAIHSRAVRVIFGASFVLAALLFLLFLGKDVMRGWQEGPQGAYGLTAWLALVSTILLVEIDFFRRSPAVAKDGRRSEDRPRQIEQ